MFMVNGTLSRIIYIGAFVLAAVVIVVVGVLTLEHVAVPGELYALLATLGTMIVGTHITPPTVEKTTVGTVEPASVYTAAHHDRLVPPTPVAVIPQSPAVNAVPAPKDTNA